MTLSKRLLKSNNKSKTTWNIINELLGKQCPSQDICEIIIREICLRNQHNIAEAFNKYFSSLIDLTNSKGKANKRHLNPSTYRYLEQGMGNFSPHLKFKSFSKKEITSIIKSFKTKNSFGYDGISTKVIKISVTYISSPLTFICNKSISIGTFPEQLKY